MYSTLMVPIDLSHSDRMERAISVATDLAAHWAAEIVFVGVTAATPGAVARSPEEYRSKLEEFARSRGGSAGVAARAHAVVSHDPATELDRLLLAAVDDTGADLVVMATHVPGLGDRLWPSHGGSLAGHSDASVLLVRAG